MCSSGKEPETTLHYLLRCDLYLIYRLELFNEVCALNGSLTNSLEEKLFENSTLWSRRLHFPVKF